MDANLAHENESVTIVVTYEIKPEQEEKFNEIINEVLRIIEKFPGFLGHYYSKTKKLDKTIHYILFRFDNLQHLKQWEESTERERVRSKLNQLIGYKPEFHYLTGLESWFSLGVNHPIIPPPRYKIALLSWAAVYCLLLLIYTLFGSYIDPLSMPLRTLIVSIIVVYLITYVVMPAVTLIFKSWLYPDTNV